MSVENAIVIFSIMKKQQKSTKKLSRWVKKWIPKRNELGTFLQLVAEFRLQDSEYHKNILGMYDGDFKLLVETLKQNRKARYSYARYNTSWLEAGCNYKVFERRCESYHPLMYLF